jgi:hypothetical protein
LGGATFDISVVRRRLDDYEVLGVGGDPFLGGDDFDRLLATHLEENGTWRVAGSESGLVRETLTRLFDVSTAGGAVNFARLVQVAEGIKRELTTAEHVERYVPDLVYEEEGRGVALEAVVDRAAFNRLIKDKVDRTVECCHEALGRARDRAGLRLGDIDHVIFVGGSSRVPLVRDTVRAAFCNLDLPEHVRSPEPLLHEPDLCVAYGAALRAATHGTRYLFPVGDRGLRIEDGKGLELHLTSPANARDAHYLATGAVRITSPDARSSILDPSLEGGSVRIRSLATGLTEEAFLDERGTFAQELELEPETDNVLEFAVCDGAGEPCRSRSSTVAGSASSRSWPRSAAPCPAPFVAPAAPRTRPAGSSSPSSRRTGPSRRW